MTTATKAKGKRATPPPAPLDPVTQYAVDVREGRILAGRAVRLACARHERDLARQMTAEFPYYFDVAAAQHVIDFFPTFLTLETGAAFVLPAWLQFCYGAIYGWKVWGGDRGGKIVVQLPAEHVKRAGCRKFMHGCLRRRAARGDLQHRLRQGPGLHHPERRDPHGVGRDRPRGSPVSVDRGVQGRVHRRQIQHRAPGLGSFFRAMSSQHRSKSGPRPHYVLSDEIHEHRDGTVVSKAEAASRTAGSRSG
jgi:hypothetical protein